MYTYACVPVRKREKIGREVRFPYISHIYIPTKWTIMYHVFAYRTAPCFESSRWSHLLCVIFLISSSRAHYIYTYIIHLSMAARARRKHICEICTHENDVRFVYISCTFGACTYDGHDMCENSAIFSTMDKKENQMREENVHEEKKTKTHNGVQRKTCDYNTRSLHDKQWWRRRQCPRRRRRQ